MHTFVCEGIGAFYNSKWLTSLPWCRVLFVIGILISVFFGILSLQESFLLTPSVRRKIFLYICKRGDQARPRQGRQLRLLPRRGCQLRLFPRRVVSFAYYLVEVVSFLLPRRGRQLHLLPRQGRQLRLLPRSVEKILDSFWSRNCFQQRIIQHSSMTKALSAKNNLGFVDGSILEPSNPDYPLFQAWWRCNDMVIWLMKFVKI